MKNNLHIKKAAFGFSLLELMVVIVLVGGLIAIVVPSINALGGLNIRNEITKIAGLTSEVYALAAISGTTHRIIFDLDNRTYWVEQKLGDAGEIKPELGYEDLMKSRIRKKDDENKEQDPAQKYMPDFEAVSGPLGEKNELPKNLIIYGAWTEQMNNDVARAGQVAVYFFSGGYTQSSFVSLSVQGDEEKNAMYLSLSPLTGAIKIALGEPNISDLLIVESDEKP